MKHCVELEEELAQQHTKQFSTQLKKEKIYDTTPNCKAKPSNDHQLPEEGNDDVKISMSQEDKENLDAKVNQYVERSEDGLFYCNLCGNSAKQKIVVKDHIEAKHLEGIEIPCPICGKIFRSRNRLRHHRH